MKFQKKRLLACLLALVIALPVSALAAVHTPEEQQMMADLLAGSYGGNTVQYALMDGGEIVVSGVSSDSGLDRDSVYGIGSTSKMFTTVVIMKLVDQGLIDLDKPVTAYVPDFTMADARYKQITVRMLLNHSSGIMGSSFTNAFLWDDNDTGSHDKLLDYLSTQRLKADPGAYSVYCNDGFTLAEIVAERVTGKSFTDLISEYISGPLGLQRTKTPQDDLAGLRFAPLYINELAMPNESVNVIGTGGVYSTAEELAAFGQIFTGEVAVLSDAARLATMEKEYKKGQWMEDVQHNVFGYGLGWDSVDLYPFSLYGITALVKGGDTTNFHASLVVLPEHNMSAAVLSSGGSSTYNEMLATQLLLDRLEETGVIKERIEDIQAFYTAEDIKGLDFDPAPYNGYYMDAADSVYLVEIDEEGVLKFALTAYPELAQKMVYCGDGKFADESGTVLFYFETQNGNTYLIQEAIQAVPALGQLRMAIYVGQKVPEGTVEDAAQEAWAARDGSVYWLANEKYTSQYFILGAAKVSVELDENLPGYIGSARIADENRAEFWVTIPGMYGRDTMDYTVFHQDGVEYLAAKSMVFIHEDEISDIYSGLASYCTIQEDGYSRWYRIGEALDGKTMTVSCPDESGFILLDAEGDYVAQSAITGEYTVVLPAGGYLVFAGDVGHVFDIAIQ